MASETWDYVVVGAGSSGCALTEELVKTGRSVLLLEAGGHGRSPFIKFPAAQLHAIRKYDWGYFTEPDVSRHGVVEHWARGRVLGGSSSVNGTMYMRGVSKDYDGWGVPGWAWRDILPIFQEFEASDQAGSLRGRRGRLAIRTVRRPHPLTRAFVEAAEASGLPLNPDYNGESQEGVGLAQLSQRRGLRCSAADAFLKPVLNRRNLTVIAHALVTRIDVSKGRAIAVCFEERGRPKRVAAGNVVLCAGAINSPQLLMLSGIGRARDLATEEIEVVSDLPGVGANLQDQPLISPRYRTKVPSYNLTDGLSQKIGYASEFLLRGEGPIANVFEAAAFLRSTPELPMADLQVIFSAVGYGKKSDGQYYLDNVPSLSAHIILSYPESAGRISLRSKDPRDKPRIECSLLEVHEDVAKLVSGLKSIRRIMETAPIADLISSEIVPGGAVQSDSELEDFVRRHASISFHPIGTCRMGLGPEAVVGPDLRVRGFENLWIADASIIPKHPSANTNAVCIMVGRKLGRELAAARQ